MEHLAFGSNVCLRFSVKKLVHLTHGSPSVCVLVGSGVSSRAGPSVRYLAATSERHNGLPPRLLPPPEEKSEPEDESGAKWQHFRNEDGGLLLSFLPNARASLLHPPPSSEHAPPFLYRKCLACRGRPPSVRRRLSEVTLAQT